MSTLKENVLKSVNKHIIDREEERLRKKKNNGSFGEIVWRHRPSHQCHNIKLGHVVEAVWNDSVKSVDNNFKLIDDDRIDIGGTSTQMDVLFVDDQSKKVYYFESKNNINLDTEKGPATAEKVEKVRNALEGKYSGYDVIAKILTGRYSTTSVIPKNLFKNNLTKDNIIGYNDFFELIGHHQTSEKEWANIWYEIGTYILDETRRIEEAA